MNLYTDTESGFGDVPPEIINATDEPGGVAGYDVLKRRHSLGAWLSQLVEYLGHFIAIKVGALILARKGVISLSQALTFGNAFLRPSIARRFMVVKMLAGVLDEGKEAGLFGNARYVPWGWLLDDICTEGIVMLNRHDASRPGYYASGADMRRQLVGLRPHEMRMIVAGVLINAFKTTGEFKVNIFFDSEEFRVIRGTFRVETVADLLIGIAPYGY